jgi:uncharacterized protein YsxB (DUF464 family)
MVRLNVKKSNKDSTINAFTVSGHAGYARRAGELDIVCSAISGIVYAALGYMEEYYGMKDFVESDGYIKWEAPNNMSKDNRDKINAVLEAMVVGIRQVEAAYCKYVKVVIEEV